MRIATWNMQGNAYNGDCSTLTEVKARMIREDIDVFCLQESGNFFGSISAECWNRIFPEYEFYVARNMQIGTSSRGILVNVYYVAYGKENLRCSMAIIVKSELDTGKAAITYINPNLRPVIGVLLNDNTAVYNIHAPSGNHNFAASVTYCFLQEIQDFKLKYNIDNYVLIGDFNCPPDVMKKNVTYANKTHYADEATQNSGACLDYCIASISPQNMYINKNAAFSDHRQVVMDF